MNIKEIITKYDLKKVDEVPWINKKEHYLLIVQSDAAMNERMITVDNIEALSQIHQFYIEHEKMQRYTLYLFSKTDESSPLKRFFVHMGEYNFKSEIYQVKKELQHSAKFDQ